MAHSRSTGSPSISSGAWSRVTAIVTAFAVEAGRLETEAADSRTRYRFSVTLVLADTAIRGKDLDEAGALDRLAEGERGFRGDDVDLECLRGAWRRRRHDICLGDDPKNHGINSPLVKNDAI